MTQLSTIGHSCDLTILATRFFRSNVFVWERKSFASRVESWKESCT